LLLRPPLPSVGGLGQGPPTERAAAERRPQTTVLVMALEEYLGVKPAAKPTTKAKGRRG
jgi:hypothetical protein